MLLIRESILAEEQIHPHFVQQLLWSKSSITYFIGHAIKADDGIGRVGL
jgi:hypothetical protein